MSTNGTEDKDTLSIYREGAKWLVSLAGAAVGGAFTQYEKIIPLASPFKWLFIIAVFTFLAMVICGVFQYYWLNYANNQKELRDNFARKLEATPGSTYREDWTRKRDEANANYKSAGKSIRGFNKIILFLFPFGIFFAALLSVAVFYPGKADKPSVASTVVCCQTETSRSQFEIALSAVHTIGRRKEAHTFLLNKNTGEVWQLVCRSHGQVAFRRVHKIGFNDLPEDEGLRKASPQP